MLVTSSGNFVTLYDIISPNTFVPKGLLPQILLNLEIFSSISSVEDLLLFGIQMNERLYRGGRKGVEEETKSNFGKDERRERRGRD